MVECSSGWPRFPKPLVAAVNGHAIAGGAIMMLACDQRLLARGPARIGLTEVLVGVQFPAWALEIARFATPPEHFQTLICTGRTYEPEAALARGLVDELVEPERLLDRAMEVAAGDGRDPAGDVCRHEAGRAATDDSRRVATTGSNMSRRSSTTGARPKCWRRSASSSSDDQAARLIPSHAVAAAGYSGSLYFADAVVDQAAQVQVAIVLEGGGDGEQPLAAGVLEAVDESVLARRA